MPCAVAKEGRIPARLRLGRINDDDEPALGPFGETFEAFIVPEFVEPLEVMERRWMEIGRVDAGHARVAFVGDIEAAVPRRGQRLGIGGETLYRPPVVVEK